MEFSLALSKSELKSARFVHSLAGDFLPFLHHADHSCKTNFHFEDPFRPSFQLFARLISTSFFGDFKVEFTFALHRYLLGC